MKKSIAVFSFLSVLIMIVSCTQSNSSSKDWKSSFIVWQKDLYAVTSDIVKEQDVGESIGKVTSYSDQEVNARKGEVFSNEFQKGSIIYEIQGMSTEEAIVVKEQGVLTKLINKGGYDYR
ncbi:hypothetical protein WAK64_08580 [Bacillus spongiae]|uniref:DUF3221 domain-containing protein n=1 Tax=Bacillus spongiae TaxID=2683610 RepID=A0ABU8HCP2_9BACI